MYNKNCSLAYATIDVKTFLLDRQVPEKWLRISLSLWWPRTVKAKTKTSRQNQRPHGKTKNLTAKPNTSQKKQNSFGLAVGICFCRAVFGFSAMKYLALLWGLWFCRQVFGFVVRYFVFAVRFLVLPWQWWTTVVSRPKISFLIH